MPKNPQEIADKWVRNLSASTQSIQNGVNAVTEAPSTAAIAAIPRMLAGIQEAAASGKIEAGLRRVSLEDWRSKMIEKGIPRIASGAQSAKSNVTDFWQSFLPWLESGQRKLESMPRGDLEQNIARAIEMMRHNSQFRRSN